MMLTKTLRQSFSFNIMNAFAGLKNAVRAPVKHLKSYSEPTGNYYSPQTNTTSQGFDQVSHQWQAYMGSNPFDLQTYNYFENAQLANFGTVDNPLVIFTADAPFRYVGCSGATNEDDYQSHELFWIMLREGPLQRCCVCGQVFKLVRLRNEFSAEMDYYMSNFNQLWYEDLGEHDITNNLSLSKADTHFEHSLMEQPENSVYSLIASDEHDRVLTDPAYRMQRQTQSDVKARIYKIAMDEYENQKIANNPYREPISKQTYENLIEAQALMKKLDRKFRQVIKFESRKYVDPENHERRQTRMIDRSNQRWNSAFTIFTGNLNEDIQKYRDYFETDIQNDREDERLEEYLDKQEVLTDSRYNLNKFDFQEGYTISPQDDQSSYIEKKIFKFKYRKALDSSAQYQRRNQRMVQNQGARFQSDNVQDLISNYILDPQTYEKKYLQFLESQSVKQYNDYFQSEQDDVTTEVMKQNKSVFALAFENWHLPKEDTSSFKTLPLPEWQKSLGFWPNTVALLKEIQRVGQISDQIDKQATLESISQSSLVKKNKQN